jgi:hypothetical protein
MIHHAESAKSRTVALPNVNKGLLQARHIQAKLNGRTSPSEGAWGPMAFGPYLVPLTRRVE